MVTPMENYLSISILVPMKKSLSTRYNIVVRLDGYLRQCSSNDDMSLICDDMMVNAIWKRKAGQLNAERDDAKPDS